MTEFSFRGYNEIVNCKRGTERYRAYRDCLSVKEVDMLPNGRGVGARLGDVLLVNVYALSGNQHRRERNAFFADVTVPLFQGPLDRVVLGGDFNCVLEDSDCTGSANTCQVIRGS